MPTLDPSQSADAPRFELVDDAWGRLVLIAADGAQHVDVAPVRAFPLSEPGRSISICDAHGKELVWIASPEGLPSELRRKLEVELARREFVPTIRRIRQVTLNVEPAEWQVETDRGPTKFLTEGGESVRRVGSDGCLITDVYGMRYRVIDRKHLDAASRRLLEQYF